MAVVAKLAKKVGLQISPTSNIPRPFDHHALPIDTKKKVIDFYKRDDISRALPDQKQVKSVKCKETGTRILCPKQVLNYTVRQTFKLFKE